jgi:hypothetical protein
MNDTSLSGGRKRKHKHYGLTVEHWFAVSIVVIALAIGVLYGHFHG